MSYNLVFDNWDNKEIEALHNVIDTRQFTMGDKVEQFEKEIASFHNVKYGVMTNSGSSANLLMISTLIECQMIQAGDEIIVPAVGWSTSYAPFSQFGLKLVFVDVDENGNIDIDKVVGAISKKTKLLLGINLLGYPIDLVRLKEVCDKNDIILLEDNCESFGASFDDKLCGTYGLMGTLSFFFSHHITTMEGGMLLTDSLWFYETAKSIRSHGWSRHSNDFFSKPKTFEDKWKESFKFYTRGFCLRPSELNAAVGLVQLQKWEEQKNIRLINAAKYCKVIENNRACYTSPFDKNATYFGFLLTLPDNETRQDVIKSCIENDIESRPVVTGNFLDQPVIEKMDHEVRSDIVQAKIIEDCSMMFGNSPKDLSNELEILNEVLVSNV